MILTPLEGQTIESLKVVAHRVGFTRLNSTGNLNGLFEYNPASAATFNTNSVESTAFDKLGATFSSKSAVNALATEQEIL